MNISKIIAAGALATSLAVAQEDAWPADEQTDASTSSATEAEEAEPAEEAAEQSSEAAEPQSETTAQTASEPAPAASEQADTRTAYDSGDNAYAENTASAPQKTNTLNSKMGVGAHIDFNSSGEWQEVEMQQGALPEGIIPQPVAESVKKNYPNAHIVRIERDRRSCEVELSNGLELTFDKHGRLRGIDD